MKNIVKIRFIVFLLFISNTFLVFSQTEPIFEIKNDAGQTVFAVYPGGVKIFVDDQLKATGGGFTVGRLSTGKAAGDDIFSVNLNDVRVNIDEAAGLKATGGGFTVGRLSTGKAAGGDIFNVQPNDVKVLLDQDTGLKATGGGFTVGRLSTGKATGGNHNFLTVTPDSTRVYIDSTSTSGFAVGKIGATSGLQNFMFLRKENYFIGHNSGKLTTGLYNLFLGYESGFSNTTGESNTFLGHRTGYTNSTGANNVFIGKEAGYNNISADYNTYIGYQAGYNATSNYNTAVGYQAGYSQTNWQAGTFLGYLAGKNTTGRQNVFLGSSAGFAFSSGGDNICVGAGAGGTNDFPNNAATGTKNVFIGYYTGYEPAAAGHNVIVGAQSPFGSTQITGSRNVYIGEDAGNESDTASNNVFIGYNAGLNETASSKLYIANSSTATPLIYGEFDNKLVKLNGRLNIETNKYNSWAAELFNDGNSTSRWGLKIQTGTDNASGTNYMIGFYNGNGGYEGAIALTDGTLSLVQNSDKRLKENIVNTDLNALEIINSLRVVDFNFIKSKNAKHTGYIAQEAMKVFPYMVNYNKEKDIYGITPSKLIPVLHKAIQEQQKQIEALKEKNAALSQQVSEIDALKTEMSELKAMVKEIAGTTKESKTESAK